jgi:hypothetical protein
MVVLQQVKQVAQEPPHYLLQLLVQMVEVAVVVLLVTQPAATEVPISYGDQSVQVEVEEVLQEITLAVMVPLMEVVVVALDPEMLVRVLKV